MKDFFHRVLLPGVLTATVVGIYGQELEQHLQVRPHIYSFWHSGVFAFYGYMMPAFALGGALGAWYSRHLGGTVRQRALSGTFPAIINFCLFVVPFPFTLAIDRGVGFLTKLQALSGYTLSQVLVPGLAMLLGTLPFLIAPERRELATSQSS